MNNFSFYEILELFGLSEARYWEIVQSIQPFIIITTKGTNTRA